MDLAFLAVPWILGIVAAQQAASAQGRWSAAIALFGLGIAGICVQRALAVGRSGTLGLPWLTQHVVLPAGALAAGLAFGARAPQAAEFAPRCLAELHAHVTHVEHRSDGTARNALHVRSGRCLAEGTPIDAGLLAYAGPWPLPEGAEVRVLARLSPWVPFRNPTPHPQLASDGPRAYARLVATDAVRVVQWPWLPRAIEHARNRVRAGLQRTLPATEAAMARALVLGDGQALDDDIQSDIRGAGLSHVLAVSGLHVVIVAGLLWGGLARLLVCVPWLVQRSEPRRIAAACAVPAVLAFAGFAGGAPSAWRAAVTGALGLGLVVLGRRPDPVAVTSAAVIGMSLVEPSEVSRPGFLLSVAATAAILSIPTTPGRPASALDTAWQVNWRTQLATAPLVLYMFGHVPLPGLLANLVLVPFSSLWLLPGGLVHGAVAALLPGCAAPTAALFGVGARAFDAGSAAFAALDTQARLPPLDVWQALLLATGCTAVLLTRGARGRLLCLVGTLLALGAEEWRLRAAEQPTDELRVTFLDVGQGDAALVDLPDGRLMLVDAGGNPGGGPDPGARVLVPLLAARRRSVIDVVVLTHPHPDHYGGLAAVLDAVRVREIWDSGQGPAERELSATAEATAELLQRARALGSRVHTPAELCDAPRRYGGARVEVLAPCPNHDSGYDANDNSLVLRVQFGSHSVLLTGDVEAHGEQQLLSRTRSLQVDVLKVPHHGSRTSSSEALLDAVRPTLAVISAGAVNGFGHPHPEVAARLRARAPHVLSTATHGGIVVTTDGHALDAHTWSGDARALDPVVP